MVNQKLELTASLLQEKLNLRLATAASPAPVAKAYDANGDVYLTVTLGSGNNSVEAIIKFQTYPAPASGATDALGLTQRVYSPHIAKVLFDSNVAGAPAGSLGGTAWPVKLAILGEVLRIGTRVEQYVKDAGAGNLALADIAAVNFNAAFESLEWGGAASV